MTRSKRSKNAKRELRLFLDALEKEDYLEPVRLTGVQSNGMLVAATNNACGCKVIFVDDMEGTMIR